ncbi:hypothetical protein R6Q57_004286 [Mikania cordata]
MDNNTSVDQLRISGKISHKLDDNSTAMEAEGIVHPHLSSSSPSMVDNGGFALNPTTPDSNKESSELMSCFTSPLTLISCMNKNDDDNHTTMKNLEESRGYAARRLTFISTKIRKDCERLAEDDDMLLEAVYDSILECIVSDMVGEISAFDLSTDGLRTPRFAPRLTGIAEICPGPPLKSVKKPRNIDLSLCRKLEF